jgi:acetoacetyl-CoA synthetase
MNRILWQPRAEAAAATQIAALARARDFEGEDAIPRLWHWSIEHPAEFWQDVWDLGEVKASRKADAVLADRERMPGARWFGGARLNFAGNLLRRDDDTPALANDETSDVRAAAAQRARLRGGAEHRTAPAVALGPGAVDWKGAACEL